MTERVATVGEILEREAPMNAIEKIEPQESRAAAVTPPEMLRYAIDKGANIEALERLMTLSERWEANEARKAFVAALTAFKSEQHEIIKNKEVTFGNNGKAAYKHATLDNVCNVIASGLAEHQLSHRWEVDQLDGGAIRVTCVLTHALGHSERVSLQASPDTSGSKNGIQAIGSTVTYLERYSLLAATGLATKDQDDDAGRNKALRITPEQKAELIEIQKGYGTDTAKFLKYLKVETLDDLPAVEFEEAKIALKREYDSRNKKAK